MFEAAYQAVSEAQPEWGRVAVLPWDTEIFGFRVGDYQIGDPRAIAAQPHAFKQALTDWAIGNQVELVSCNVPADDARWRAVLAHCEFMFIDSTLRITNSRVQATDLPRARRAIRIATPADQPDVERIAAHAFRFGRYHADPYFPREFADRRYKHWARNAFATLSPENPIHVMDQGERVVGFSHLQRRGDNAIVTIIAVAQELQGGLTGYDLSVGLMNKWKQEGIRHTTGKISTGNLAIMNMAAHFGWRFSEPQMVFHWHTPGAPHLAPGLRAIT